MEVESSVKLSWKCLKKMATIYKETNPALSRYYLSRSVKMKTKVISNMSANAVIPKKTSYCFHCFTILHPDNHSVRIKPRIRLLDSLKKLLPQTSSKPLGTFQEKMVDRYLHSKNKLVISCFTCEKNLKIDCQSREERKKKLAAPPPPQIEEKVKTKKQRQREKRRKMKQKKKFCKFLFDNEEEALAASKKNSEPLDDSEQSSVSMERVTEIKLSPVDKEKPEIKHANITQKNTSQHLGKVTETNNLFKNSVSRKRKNVVINSDLISKKKKGRDIHLQLQKVLAADKQKKSGNSLEDFLSSL